MNSKGVCHALTLPVTTGQEAGNGGSGGTRTRHQSNDSKGGTGLASQIASQSPGVPPDLRRVIDGWAGLSLPLREAVAAMIDTANLLAELPEEGAR